MKRAITINGTQTTTTVQLANAIQELVDLLIAQGATYEYPVKAILRDNSVDFE